MSEEQRITKVEKEKDPRRVEAGKRLGAISRATKERKAVERSAAEQSHVEDRESMNDTENSEISYMSVIAGVGVLTGLVCLYFTYKQDKRATQVVTEPSVPQKQSPVRQPVGIPSGSRAGEAVIVNYAAWTTEHHRIHYNKEKYAY